MCGDKCTKFSFVILVALNTALILLSVIGTAMIGISLNPSATAKVADLAGKAGVKGEVDMSQLTELMPKAAIYGGFAITLMVFLLAVCGCCGAITMKRAADNSKSDTDDEYDYADLNETATHSPSLLIYIVIMTLFLVLELAFGAMAFVQYGSMVDGMEQEAVKKGVAGAKKATAKAIDAMKKTTVLVTESKDVKIQQAWMEVQDSLQCCGMFSARDALTGKDGDGNTWGNYGSWCCDGTYTAGTPTGKKDDEKPSCSNNEWATSTGNNTTPACNDAVFEIIRDNFQTVGIFCMLVMFIEVLCLGAAIHLRFCSVKKTDE